MRQARKRDQVYQNQRDGWQPRTIGTASAELSVSTVPRRVKLGRKRRLQQDHQMVDVRLKFAGNVDPARAIGRIISEALDPTRAPGKIRTMADMSPAEIAALVPPRKAG